MIKNIFKIIIISIFLLLSNNASAYSGDYIYRNSKTGNIFTNINGIDTDLGIGVGANTYFRLSKDGTKILYYNYPYVKTRLISGNGAGDIVLTANTTNIYADFSDDGNSIYYTAQDSYFLYKKSAFDDSIGVVYYSGFFTYNPIDINNSKIVYINPAGFLCYADLGISTIENVVTTTVTSIYSPILSKDNKKIIFQKWNGGSNFSIDYYDINSSSLLVLYSVNNNIINPVFTPDNLSFNYQLDNGNGYQRLVGGSGGGNLFKNNISMIFFFEMIEPIGCYKIKTGYSFTGTLYKDLFNGENISDYGIINGNTGYIYNNLILNNTVNKDKYSLLFSATDPSNIDPVNYYNNGQLCTEINCIKSTLFSSGSNSYIQILNQNLFISNNQNILWFNTSLNNINSFSLYFDENYNYTLYGRKNNNSNYEEIGWLKTYDINGQGGDSYSNKSYTGGIYSDFKIILPFNSLGFSTYFKKIVIGYGGSYQTTYGNICNYPDGRIEIDGQLTDSGSIAEIIGSVPPDKTFDLINAESMWNLDVNGDGNISVYEYTIAPITISKNVIIKLYESLKNIWNFLNEILKIGKIAFIPNVYADSGSILNNLTNLTVGVYGGNKTEVKEITNIINITKYGFFFALFFSIIFLFFYFRFLKN